LDWGPGSSGIVLAQQAQSLSTNPSAAKGKNQNNNIKKTPKNPSLE
jgi:hypothetical protein